MSQASSMDKEVAGAMLWQFCVPLGMNFAAAVWLEI